MIREAEIRRIAGAAGVEPRIVELDYVLGWALLGIAEHEFLADRLVFKGGTCIRKCYFPAYRFSEDLDFTAIRSFGWDELESAVREAFVNASRESGVDFAAAEPRLRVIDGEYGRESLRFTVYWRGPRPSSGSAPGLRLDVTRNEVLVFEPLTRAITHSFSDAADLHGARLACYRLEEVMAEKIRAALGQRVFAVSRDLYDIHRLIEHVDGAAVLDALPRKLDARAVDVEVTNVERFVSRRDEFRADWQRNLAGLLPPGAEEDFDPVWGRVVAYVGEMASGLGRHG